MLSWIRRACVVVVIATAHAEPGAVLPLALREVPPEKLSAGLFLALDAQGAFGRPPPPARLHAGGGDLSKGRPPAVLDARVGANTRLGDDPVALPTSQRSQAEPHLIRSAVNPDVLLATFQDGRFVADGGALDNGYAVSKDGGFTWARALVPQLTFASGGPYFRATDPVAAAGPQGDLYLNALASLDNAFGRVAVVVSRSSDNGATWTAPSVVYQSLSTQVMPDKNWLAANDFIGAQNSGRLVATWTSFTSTTAGASTGNNIVAAVSDDRGDTWSAPINVTPAGSNNQGSQPVFLPDGSLLIVYAGFVNTQPNGFIILGKRSLDGGRTFPAGATTIVASVESWDDPQLRDGVSLPTVAVARQTGEIFVGYTGIVNGSPRVLVTKSSDSGATWTAPMVVSDQPAGSSVVNPAIAVTPDGRAVSVVFIDKRNDPANAFFIDHYAAQSFDGGVTWQPNTRLSEMSSDIRYAVNTSRGYMLGDYLGIAPAPADDQPCVAIWCDTRTGESDPMIVRFMPVSEGGLQTWRRVYGLPSGNGTEDFDRDGASDGVEFLYGTNPRRAESGEALVLRPQSPTQVDVLWTQRTGPLGFSAPLLASDFPLKSGFPLALVPSSPVPIERLPTTPAPAGLEWQGRSFTIAADAAWAFATGVDVVPGRVPPTPGTPFAAINTDARLVNLSSRGQILGGASQLIGALVTSGANRTLLVRGVGPSLTQFVPTLAIAGDPALRFQSQDGSFVLENDDWSTTGSLTRMLITNTGVQVGAFPLGNDKEAALGGSFSAGAYSAILSNRATSGGNIGLVEIYDASTTADGQLVNLSTRAEVGAGDAALIAGVVIRGTQPRRMLIRAVGPSLARFDVGGALLADPVLTLYRGSTQIAQNDDWEIGRSSAALAATAVKVGAFALDPASLDAALLITLDPGAYTAVVTSADGGTGIALVEIYDAN